MKIIINKIVAVVVWMLLATISIENALAMNPAPMPLDEMEADAFNRHLKKYSVDVYSYDNYNYYGIGYIEYLKSIIGFNPSYSVYYGTSIMSKEDVDSTTAYVGVLLAASLYSGGDPYSTGERSNSYAYDTAASDYSMVFAFDHKSKGFPMQDAVVYPTEGNYGGLEFSTVRPLKHSIYGSLKDLVVGYFDGSDTSFCIYGADACQSDAPIIFANMAGIDSTYQPAGYKKLTKSLNYVIPETHVTQYKDNSSGTLDSFFASGTGEVRQLTQSGVAKIDFDKKNVTINIASTLYLRNQVPVFIWQDGDFDFTISINSGIAPVGTVPYDYWGEASAKATVTCVPHDEDDRCPTNLRVDGVDFYVGGRNADKIIFRYIMRGEMSVTGGTAVFSIKGLSVLSN